MNDGGPAFPEIDKSYRDCNGTAVEIRDYKVTGGMSLRDWFAGKAMQAYVTSPAWEGAKRDSIAKWAYNMADEMLKARGEK